LVLLSSSHNSNTNTNNNNKDISNNNNTQMRYNLAAAGKLISAQATGHGKSRSPKLA